MKNNKTLIIIGAVVFLLLIITIPTCSSYNGMVEMRNDAKAKWSEVQAQYQRRNDLIPNLVSTVKGYANHERETLQGVTDARTGAYDRNTALTDTAAVMDAAKAVVNAPDPNAYAGALKNLDKALSIYVNAVHEAYPDLKANENFRSLQDELAGTENRVEMARNKYIIAVRDYNTKIQKFPGNIVAGMFGFQPLEEFQASPEAQQAPKVDFNN